MFYRKYNIIPVPKPRMTQRDKWKKRNNVLRYNAYKDEVRLRKLSLPESDWHVVFQMPMPDSWPKYKKIEMVGSPHQQKPDVDNLVKALLDALFDDDSKIWDCRITKIWGYSGAIWIYSGEIQHDTKTNKLGSHYLFDR